MKLMSVTNWIALLCLLAPALASNASDKKYVGVQACASCHEKETAGWKGSHHDQAMQVADKDTVLGEFDNKSLDHYGITSRFFRKGDQYMANTDGPDGKMHDYPVKYTFGVTPLQQYLVEFPGGRLQALDVAWDSRPKEQGGQRWFALHPEDESIPPDDVLHWTGPNLNWNYMCAECHSTNLDKNYDAASRTYKTTWSEINVSCEACHGPGSGHVAWADKGADAADEAKGLTVNLNERKNINWQIDPATGKPVRSASLKSSKEIETCAVCHSRRSQIGENDDPGQGFFDNFIPSLLTEGLYHADGQIEDEVYVYGSFLQSKMHAAGVSCSDCHDPHTADLRLPGDQVCYQCHAADRYTSKQHHFHEAGTDGASCVECHMPPKTYMVVDPRHDHSFRIPRPDLSVKLGTPNACNTCHQDQTALWAAQQVKQWYGKTPQGYQQYAAALHAGRRQLPAAREMLQALAANDQQPDLARASASSMLGQYQDVESFGILKQMTDSEDPQQRLAALQALTAYDVRNRVQLVFPLLNDKVRSVRMQAAGLLASVPAGQLPTDKQDMLDNAIREYIQAQLFNAERPEAQLNLGSLYADQGNTRDAVAAYRTAIELQSRFVPAYVNLAQLYSSQGDEAASIQMLKQGLQKVTDSADLLHAYGLALVRNKDLPGALAALSRAAELVPRNARYSYVYAVALQSTGKQSDAIKVLETAYGKHPGNADILFALVSYNREAGNMIEARRYAGMLKKLLPGNPGIERLARELGG